MPAATDSGARARPGLGSALGGPVRVAILADTHGWVDPRVLGVVAGCDLAVHGGDIGGPGVLDQLRPRLGLVWAVRGNNDCPESWPANDLDRLLALPVQQLLGLPGGALALIHGHQGRLRGRHERLRGAFPQARALVYGHSHLQLVDRAADPWLLNPGAAGRQRTNGGPSCLVLTADQTRWQLETYRFPLLSASRRRISDH